LSSSLLSLILISILGKKAHQPMMAIYKCWSALFFFCAGIRIKTLNKHLLKNNLPCIIVCNHGSNLDMFLGAYSPPISIKPLAKIQLKKMPLLGFLFSTVCVLVDGLDKKMVAIFCAKRDTNFFIFLDFTIRLIYNKGNQFLDKLI
jgi:hypothetical protein